MNLQEFLDNEHQEARFIIENESQANWALRKIKELQDNIEQNNRIAEEEIEKINKWREQQNETEQNSIEHLQNLLQEYALKKREEDPTFKSLSLPNGRIGFRKQQPKWNYDDETLLTYLQQSELNDLIKTTYTPKKSELKKPILRRYLRFQAIKSSTQKLAK